MYMKTFLFVYSLHFDGIIALHLSEKCEKKFFRHKNHLAKMKNLEGPFFFVKLKLDRP